MIQEILQEIFNQLYLATGVNPIIFFSAFFIVFGIMYAITSSMDLFKERKMIAIGISFVFAFFVATSPMISNLFAKAIPGIGIFMIFLILIIFSIALIIPEGATPGKYGKYLIIILVLIVVVYLFLSSMAPETLPGEIVAFNLGGAYLSQEDVATIAIVLIFIGFIYFGWSVIKGGGK